ncbi:MAG: Ig-like domain-containing protein [Flavobacteriaceae bacterium]
MKTRFLILMILLLTLFNCARRGSLTGGDKDEKTPILIKTVPQFESINFSANEIKIYFDEYIKLKDLRKHLVVSPPLKYAPIISPQGTPSKKITIKIKDTLLPNTTYSFNFGESIIDNNEGNIISDFKYIFSTGNYIDSLKIKGEIVNAFAKKEPEYVTVMLYEANESFSDSTIFNDKPLYVANTLKSTHWEFSNLKPGKYHMIALKEENSDFVFNPKSDEIAYLDTIIEIPSKQEFKLKLFKEKRPFKTFKPIEISKNHIIIGYEGDAKNLKVLPNISKTGVDEMDYKTYFENRKDTLNFFFKTNKKIDSLFLKIINNKYKTNEKVTLRSKDIDSIKVTSNARGVLNFKDTIKVSLNNPLEMYYKNKMLFFDKDTIAVDYTLKRKGQRDLLFLFDKKESQRYKLTLLPDALVDFYDLKNDTIKYVFSTNKKINYGSITLNVTNVKNSIIVQLINSKKEVLEQRFIKSDAKVSFDLLNVATYDIRVIYDDNGNGKWDTGSYFHKIQPEKVVYFKDAIEVKENWFINEDLILE